MVSRSESRWWYAASLMCAACASEPELVASNCDQAGGCVKREALRLDAVDILLVVDDSASLADKAEQLKAELPRMLSAITTGQADDLSFPPAKSVHVAVTTTDMGGPPSNELFCSGSGQDGVFVRPGEVGVTCDVSYPGYLAYDADGAALSVVDSASCVPLVFPDDSHSGCGFEQPLEAALKALWPSDDPALSFNSGEGHGSAENAGFLRDNSLLVVIVVADEDDCSASDPAILNLSTEHRNEYSEQPPNLRCHLNADKLYEPARYIEHLKTLRPNNDNVIFTVIGGIPPELVSDDFRDGFDFSEPEQADRYFADVLASSLMQEVADQAQELTGHLKPSCLTMTDGTVHSATPPRRLVEVARGFGAQGVLGSICAPDFGATTGHIIRALGEKLSGSETP